MMRYWIYVACLLTVAWALVRMGGIGWPSPPTVWQRSAFYAASACIVLIVWGMLFRRQVEKMQISLWALMTLVLIAAIWFSLIHVVKPFWAY